MLPAKADPVPQRSARQWRFSRHSKTMPKGSESPRGARDMVCVPRHGQGTSAQVSIAAGMVKKKWMDGRGGRLGQRLGTRAVWKGTN